MISFFIKNSLRGSPQMLANGWEPLGFRQFRAPWESEHMGKTVLSSPALETAHGGSPSGGGPKGVLLTYIRLFRIELHKFFEPVFGG